jgi:hypothetical protein
MLPPSRLLRFLLLGLFSNRSYAFVNPEPAFFRRTTRLFIEDEIADMIDRELYRQQHLKDFENEWMEKNRDAVLSRLNSDEHMMSMDEEDLRENFRQMQKDKRLAEKDPRAYCAERCITTGNCDVYEDMYVRARCCLREFSIFQFHLSHRNFSLSFFSPLRSFDLSPEEVIQFCTNCVMSDGDEPCDLPDSFYEVIDEIGYEKST